MRNLFIITSLYLFSYMITYSQAQSCKTYTFSNNNHYQSCNDLPVLDSFIHWNYNPSSATLQIAYRHAGVSSSGEWVAWAINLVSTGMVGSQALVAYKASNGTMVAYTAPITSIGTKLKPGDLSFTVSGLSAVYANNQITIFATIEVPGNKTTLNQVWQNGPLSGDSPQTHVTSGANLHSMSTLHLVSGSAAADAPSPGDGGDAGGNNDNENVHGLLNAVSWGILMPIGGIIARYLRVFPSADPAWFYLHVGCQMSAYGIGVAGFATGLKLGPATSSSHGKIGITLFTLATLQMFALLIRPKKDHNLRLYWNIYHHSIGYSIMVLAVTNIFLGLNLLDPEVKWRHAYIGVLSALVFVALVLEAITWYVVIKRKKSVAELDKKSALNGGYIA
ncbi:Cytochrome b561 and DOMON domain-containing protein [Drosera capensis]